MIALKPVGITGFTDHLREWTDSIYEEYPMNDKRSLQMTASRGCLVLIMVMFALLITPLPVARANPDIILRVTTSGASSGTCGASWASPCALQYALTIAVSGDELWVKQGTYKPTTGSDRTKMFTLKSGVRLYGGFAGTESLRKSAACRACAHPLPVHG